MFHILGVNKARVIAMPKEVKIPHIEFNGSVQSRLGKHGCSLPDTVTGD